MVICIRGNNPLANIAREELRATYKRRNKISFYKKKRAFKPSKLERLERALELSIERQKPSPKKLGLSQDDMIIIKAQMASRKKPLKNPEQVLWKISKQLEIIRKARILPGDKDKLEGLVLEKLSLNWQKFNRKVKAYINKHYVYWYGEGVYNIPERDIINILKGIY